MKIAVTYDNGLIFQHFGHTEFFKIYDVENNEVVKSEVVSTNGQGHGALAGFLKAHNVDTLICGGIGGGAKAALAENGVTLYGGCAGMADTSVKALLEHKLIFNANVECTHHSHEGGEHNCGGNHRCHH